MFFEITVILERVFDLALHYFEIFPPQPEGKHNEFMKGRGILHSYKRAREVSLLSSFLSSLPFLFGFQTPLSVCLFSLEPHKLLLHQCTVPHCSLLAGGIFMVGRQKKQAFSPLLSCPSVWSTPQSCLPQRESAQVFLKGSTYGAKLVPTILSNI